MTITIKFYIFKSIQFQLKLKFLNIWIKLTQLTRYFWFKQENKNEHRHWILHIWISQSLKFWLKLTILIFFSIRVSFYQHWRLTGKQGKGEDHLLFHSTTSTCSQTFRYLVATLHVRWLTHIFNRAACIYQTATQWDLPFYRITIWFIDDVTLDFFVYVMVWF